MSYRLRPWALVAGGLLALGGAAWAQAPAAPPAPGAKHGYSVQAGLFPLLARGYHLGAAKLLGPQRRHALVVTPQWYGGRVQGLTSRISAGAPDHVRGYGLEVQHRIFLGPREVAQEGFYVGYGGGYQRFTLDYQAKNWLPELRDDGLTYYEFRLREQQTAIRRYATALVVGGQVFLPDTPVFLDMYLGLGFRWARRRATAAGWSYERNSLDYGHAGQYTPVGLRVGVAW
ncbi:hypothetical protein [Hymenobacter edaphi]|uniref:hypothetical protein n=1 Tax=Hymenobacter edaphi TaxID=2211146 RepID=UPI0010581C81|nr:hypothetical protein [Hymenobacter edaphi]